MTYDALVARVGLTLAALAALFAAARGVWRVLRSTYRVHSMLLGVGVLGDPDYRPGLDQRMEFLEAELIHVRRDLAGSHLVDAVAVVVTPKSEPPA